MLKSSPDRGCEYTFGNLFIWEKIYKNQVAYLDNAAIVKFDNGKSGYLFPVGEDIKSAIDALIDTDPEFRIIAARKEDCDLLEELYPGRFSFEQMGLGEYVYSSEKLRLLPGKKYHKKRNHISQFERACPDWKFVEITSENIDRVREMDNEWCRLYGCGLDAGLRDEHCAVETAIENLFELGMDGGLIEVDGNVVAFAVGEAINSSCYCVHIEKAFHHVNGAYAIINREFARRFCEGYELINREDDAGEEGLKKAKLSYYPEYVTEKYTITLRQ